MATADRSKLANAEASEPPARPWWPIVGLLMLVVASAQFNRVAISVAGAEHIIVESGISATRMGWVYSAFLLFYTLAMLPAGWLIDRVGARATLIMLCFGSAIFVAGTSAVGLFSPTATLLLVGLLVVRSLMGIVNAPLHPAAARMVYAQVPLRAKSFANGLVTFSACLGISATYYGFGLLAGRFGWPTAFLMTGWFTLLVGVVWVWGTRSTQNGSKLASAAAAHTPAEQDIWQILRDRGVICLTLSYAALGYFQYLFFYFLLNIFQSANAGVNEARTYSTIITLTMGVGMVAGGWLADRFGHRIVPFLAMIASGLVFELGVLDGSGRTMFYAFTISAGLLGVAEASFWTTIVGLGRKRGGFAAGLMNTGGNAGGMMSPVVVPFVASLFDGQFGHADAVRVSIAIAGVVPIIGALLWIGVSKADE